ncbi:cAMP-dependent protein kinase type II-beta regulatory subunit-like [Gordionus sp. m RMFG-2023]|uniref:cAMP-dependent protein kinase type II-beta regulatory subunit-like n=1 Tax=Gordionus sp. m RMFG-2023 TaxID=3053472 RepID=UPI0031FDF43D
MTNNVSKAVHEELNDILLQFCVSAIEENPRDLCEFGLQFFTNLSQSRENNPSNSLNQPSTRYLDSENSVIRNNIKPEKEDSTEEDSLQELPAHAYPKPIKDRRKSVSAEAYNPEECTHDLTSRVIFPKNPDQIERIRNILRDVFIFKSLDEEQMLEVIDAMNEKKVHSSEVIIKQGDEGDNFYIIESGKFEVFINCDGVSKKVCHYENSGSFGELALLYNQPRSADIICTSDGNLWALDRITFRRIVLKSAYMKRKMFDKFIQNVKLFANLTEFERMNICDALTTLYFNDGETIINQGEIGDKMYIVESGTVKILMNKNGKEFSLSTKKRGDYFGELALILNQPRSASAYAQGQVKLAALDIHAFERLLGPCIDIMKRTMLGYKM